MKRLLNYFRYDMVKTIFLIVTIFSFLMFVSGQHEYGYWLGACMIFSFRSIVWEGQYLDELIKLKKLLNENSDIDTFKA